MLKAGYFYDRTIRAERRERFPEVHGEGDCRMHDIVHNGGWYNQFGQEIGWGDMNVASMKAFSERLFGSDIVIVLGEGGRCGWEHPGHKHLACYDMEYIAENARYVLKDGTVYRIVDFEPSPESFILGELVVYQRNRNRFLETVAG